MEEADKLQYEQALSTVREQFNMLIAIVSLFFTADLAIVGFAVEAKSSSMLLVACIIPVAMFAVTIEMRRHMHPFIYFCGYMERKYEFNPGVMTTYIESAFYKPASAVMRESFKDASSMPMDIDRVNRARQVTLQHFLLKFCLPYYGTFFAVQIAVALFGFARWG